MTKKQIAQLVSKSYNKNSLDTLTVEQIGSALSRSDLKKYIRLLKDRELRNTVTITLPAQPSQKQQDLLKSIYENKQIVYTIDPRILVGMRIQDYDIITEYDLSDTLQKIRQQLEIV